MPIRPAVPQDALAVAKVHVRSWQVAYRNLLPDEYLDGLRAEDRAARYDLTASDPGKPYTIVATEDGLIRGFATSAPSRDVELADFGELCALYVDPDLWGRGIGAALVSASRDRLRAQGFTNALLWVLAGNVRAERFYSIDKWEHDGTRRTDSIWDVTVEELRYRRVLAND